MIISVWPAGTVITPNAQSHRPSIPKQSKNRQTMDEGDRDLLSQISDYSLIAIKLHRPLWSYVRVDTVVDPIYDQLTTATGGHVVYYFTGLGYVDPFDQTARNGLVATGAVILVAGVLELWSRRHRVPRKIAIKVNAPEIGQDQSNSNRPPIPSVPSQQPTVTNVNSGASATKSTHLAKPIDETLDALRRAEEAAKQTRKKLDYALPGKRFLG